jgi:phage FluMu protein Com
MKPVLIPYYQCEKCNKLLKRVENMEKHEAECNETLIDINQLSIFEDELC